MWGTMSRLADWVGPATVGFMFMGNPELGSHRADDFHATSLTFAVRLAARRFAGELAIDQAGPKERKAAERKLRQLEAEFEALQQGVEHRVRQQALIILAIHSEALYRVRGQTFNEYIRKQFKWEKSRQRAYQLLDYGRTLQEMTTRVDILPSEGQVRKQLAKLPLPERLPAWKQAVETSTTPGRVTMVHLKKVVHAHRGQVEAPSQRISGEKARIVATLRRWTKLGHTTDVSDIRRECDNLLPSSAGA